MNTLPEIIRLTSNISNMAATSSNINNRFESKTDIYPKIFDMSGYYSTIKSTSTIGLEII